MWYFSWVLGAAAAALLTVVVAMKLEFQDQKSDKQMDET